MDRLFAIETSLSADHGSLPTDGVSHPTPSDPREASWPARLFFWIMASVPVGRSMMIAAVSSVPPTWKIYGHHLPSFIFQIQDGEELHLVILSTLYYSTAAVVSFYPPHPQIGDSWRAYHNDYVARAIKSWWFHNPSKVAVIFRVKVSTNNHRSRILSYFTYLPFALVYDIRRVHYKGAPLIPWVDSRCAPLVVEGDPTWTTTLGWTRVQRELGIKLTRGFKIRSGSLIMKSPDFYSALAPILQ